MKHEEKALLALQKAYETYNPEELIKLLDEDIRYNSFWVLQELRGKKEYSEYITGKLNTMKKIKKLNKFKMITTDSGLSMLICLEKSPSGTYGAFSVKTNKEGKVTSIDLYPPELHC